MRFLRERKGEKERDIYIVRERARKSFVFGIRAGVLSMEKAF